MKVISQTADLPAGPRPVSVAIGVFDGIHLGHQEILRQAVTDARGGGVSLALTFDRHPNSIVAPAAVPAMIYPLSKKLQLLEALGLDAVCVIPFDESFSRKLGADFVRGLVRDCGKVSAVSVGGEFVFGHKRSGNVALLREMGRELGFVVNPVGEVLWEGQAVSSTRVRETVRAGNFAGAGAMLGRPYALCGPVIHGAGMGRKIGAPTANLDVPGLVTPPHGVYAARALVRGKFFNAAVNLGLRPTFTQSSPSIHLEAHLLDFSEDIYGAEMELEFVKKIRDEKKFASVDALKAQIERDVEDVRKVLSRP